MDDIDIDNDIDIDIDIQRLLIDNFESKANVKEIDMEIKRPTVGYFPSDKTEYDIFDCPIQVRIYSKFKLYYALFCNLMFTSDYDIKIIFSLLKLDYRNIRPVISTVYDNSIQFYNGNIYSKSTDYYVITVPKCVDLKKYNISDVIYAIMKYRPMPVVSLNDVMLINSAIGYFFVDYINFNKHKKYKSVDAKDFDCIVYVPVKNQIIIHTDEYSIGFINVYFSISENKNADKFKLLVRELLKSKK